MQFQNLQVQWETLPRASAAELKPIEKDYLKVLYLSWSIFYTILVAAWLVLVLVLDALPKQIWVISGSAVLVIAILASYIVGTASFRRKAYAVREKDILYRTGWVVQRLHIVPFNRVQHCVVQSGPIERKFGLSSVSIFTAASNMNDISIKGLKHEDAETLKAFILDQIQPLV